MSTETALTQARAQLQRELVAAGLLVPGPVDGLYGRSGAFEDVVDGIDVVVRAAGAHLGAERFRFPPVLPRVSFEHTDYIASFPNLTGAVTTFAGDDAAHRALLAARAEGQPWDEWLTPTDTMLVSAACHPAYSMLTGVLPEGGRTLDVYGYCFRHEPAIDPARMQAFRMHEYVVVGAPEQAMTHRDDWVGRGLTVLGDLGLEAEAVIANDPFFGRAGRMLSANQREENLKTELVVRLYGELDEGTAVVSCNCHREHFGSAFAIATTDGEVAHSACVGFGMERIALAMFRTHGLDQTSWPVRVRARMGW